MKKTIGILLIAISTAATVVAQGKKEKAAIPTAAKTAFEKKFPGATNVKWEMEHGDYEVNFKQKGTGMSAVFDKNGTHKETETEIAVSALPASVVTYVKQHYAGHKVKEAAKIEQADGTINYEAEVGDTDVLFDAAGKFVREAKD